MCICICIYRCAYIYRCVYICVHPPHKYTYLFNKANMYTYINCSEDLAFLDFVYLWRNFITEKERRCNSTYKSKQRSVQSQSLLPLVITNDVLVAKLGVVFCAFMPSEYPYCAFFV